MDERERETLEAALSMLEHYEPLEDETGLLALVDLNEDDIEAFEGGNATEPTRQVAPNEAIEVPKRSRSRKKADGFHPNRSREKRKEEIMYLRAKVNDMEAQLAVLQQNETSANCVQRLANEPATGDGSSGSSIGASMWEQIAVRQSSERRKTELENVHLKLVLEGQIKVARSLERLLSKRNNRDVSRMARLVRFTL